LAKERALKAFKGLVILANHFLLVYF